MSDDDDDLGGLKSMAAPVRAKKATNTARTAKPNSRAENGQSSKPAKGRKNTQKAATAGDSEIEELPNTTNPFDFSNVADEDEPPVQQVRSGRADAAPVANGKPEVKAKRTRVPQKKTITRMPLAEPMDVDPIEVPDDTEEERSRRPHKTPKPNGPSKPTPTDREDVDEISRLKAQLERARGQIAALSVQLEQVRLHQAETEKLYKQQQAQTEKQLKATEDVIKEMNVTLVKKLPLIHSLDSPVLDLLTRAEADEEKQNVEQEVQRWKGIAEQRKRDIEERDERLRLLEQNLKDVRIERDAEIERSASLAKNNRGPPSVTRGGRPPGVDDPKNAQVIRFYEDMTNLLVTVIKVVPGQHLDLDDWIATCIYTFNEEDDKDTVLKNLHFNLRLFHEIASDHEGPVTSKDQLIPTVHYTPRELDKEDLEFVAQLDFLQAPFSFPRGQLPLFLRTIYTKISEALKVESDDDSVQEIQPE